MKIILKKDALVVLHYNNGNSNSIHTDSDVEFDSDELINDSLWRSYYYMGTTLPKFNGNDVYKISWVIAPHNEWHENQQISESSLKKHYNYILFMTKFTYGYMKAMIDSWLNVILKILRNK